MISPSAIGAAMGMSIVATINTSPPLITTMLSDFDPTGVIG